jgi:hypothetical protein
VPKLLRPPCEPAGSSSGGVVLSHHRGSPQATATRTQRGCLPATTAVLPVDRSRCFGSLRFFLGPIAFVESPRERGRAFPGRLRFPFATVCSLQLQIVRDHSDRALRLADAFKAPESSAAPVY